MIGDDFPKAETSQAVRQIMEICDAVRQYSYIAGLKEAILIAEYSGEPYCNNIAALIRKRVFDMEQEGK